MNRKPTVTTKSNGAASQSALAADSKDALIIRRLPVILFVLSLGYYLWAVSIGWSHTIADRHPFRQTQTAISAYYMIREPFKLAYETPVLGPPWALPMEFPLYQWMAAGLVKTFGFALDQTGRFLSVAFYLLTLIPAYFLLGTFRVAPAHRLLALSLLLASPFYIFWSRTFMIETCGVFFCVAYLACAFKALESRKPGMFALACVLGILAGLVKITTVIPFGAAVGLFAIRDYLKLPLRLPSLSELWWTLFPAALLCGLPVIAGIGWARFADGVKEQNVLGHFMASKSLTAWNFGTLDQKLSTDIWNVIFQRIPTLFSTDIVFWSGCILIIVLSIECHSRWKLALASGALFLFSPVLFTNLHFIHDYYMCANGVFLISAAAFLIVGFLESKSWKPLGFALVGAALLAGGFGHYTQYLPIQRYNADSFLPLARQIRDTTPLDAINVIVGLDWDPSIPYYSERRALMIPDWNHLNLQEREVRKAFANLRGQKIGVVLLAHSSRWAPESIVRIMKENSLPTDRVLLIN